ncbi:MAG: L-serine dehydratase [Cellvibrionaceae bacterium]|jgi:L-serine dehydratase
MNISVFDLFKIGIGPSSSHTVGPMIAAKKFISALTKKECLHQTDKINIELFGSLGSTGKGHGTSKAIILGLEGETPSGVDVTHIAKRIEHITRKQKLLLANSIEIHFNQKEDIIFHRKKSLPYHSNGMRFRCFNKNRECLLEKFYYSVGGGFIVNEEQAKKDSALIQDEKNLPYPFNTGKELLQLCQEHQLCIADIMFENEQAWHKKKNIISQLDTLWNVMQACVERGCEQQGVLPGGLKVERRAKKLHERLLKNDIEKSDESLTKDPLQILDWVTLYALAVNEENASGGRIVTAPTNGAAGIIPAVLHYYSNFISGSNQKGIHNFLLTAAAIGILFKKNASISGAEVGCQGEVGSACSMAAAGLTAVLGGTPEQIENAAEVAMEHHLGLTCDPIGGLVQIPCIERNAVASVKAIHASRIALSSDGHHFVSLDKVIKTMRETGKDMLSKYKETSRGGLATNVIDVPVNIIEC